MKIGLLADVHGNIYGLNACLDKLRTIGVDRILCAGDIIGYYPFVNEVIEALKDNDVTTIRGNHEAYFLGHIKISEERFKQYSLDWVERNLNPPHRTFITELPESYSLELDSGKLTMFHGSPWSIEEYVYPDHRSFDRFLDLDATVIVLGQTHIPMLHKVGQVMIVNPGSCGQPRDFIPQASCAVIDTETMEVQFHRVDYDIDSVCQKVMAEGLWHELSRILTRTRKGPEHNAVESGS